jgi:hypothetical protein
MRRNPIAFRCVTLAAVVVMTSSCVEVPLVPGADRVRFMQNAADVIGCKPVGNVSTRGAIWDPVVEANLRNKTVGLDGNALFLTTGVMAERQEGVAYRCP